MKAVTVMTSAKVNLALRVLGRRADGYHEVQTVLHTIGLWDRLDLLPNPQAQTITLETDSPEVPADESNLCWRAANLLRQRGSVEAGVLIKVEKTIPAGAGLGGGSSAAAATLLGLLHAWQLDLPTAAVQEWAAELGADVPFFLRGGCCLAQGRGDKLTLLPDLSASLVLLVPEQRIPTAEAYRALGRPHCQGIPCTIEPEVEPVVHAVRAGDLEHLGRALHNDFETLSLPGIAEARRAKQALIEAGCLGASISGSGSAVFGIAPDSAAAQQIAARLHTTWQLVKEVATIPAGNHLLIQDLTETQEHG